jgi:hypothetical protein
VEDNHSSQTPQNERPPRQMFPDLAIEESSREATIVGTTTRRLYTTSTGTTALYVATKLARVSTGVLE